jgi:inositol transport system permease protein
MAVKTPVETKSTPEETSPRSRFFQRLDLETLGVPIAFIVLCGIFSLLSPNFLTFTNLSNIGRQVASIAIVSCGMTMIIISAGIDLSPGAVVALVSVVAASVLLELGFLPAIIAGILVGVAFGLAAGVLVGVARIPPFIVTLGFLSVARGMALTYTNGVPVFGLRSPAYDFLGKGAILNVPVSVLIALLSFVVTHLLLTRTKMGIFVYAIGGNEEAAIMTGVPVVRYKILIYIFAGLMTGIAGVLLGARVNSGQPLLGTGLELQAIAAVVIGGTSLFGGKGNIIGTFFGVLLIGVLSNGLNLLSVSSFVQQIVIGAVIIIAVLVSVLRER